MRDLAVLLLDRLAEGLVNSLDLDWDAAVASGSVVIAHEGDAVRVIPATEFENQTDSEE